MNTVPENATLRVDGVVTANGSVSSGLLKLDLELSSDLLDGAHFLPGQFAMLNLPGSRGFVFSRPFSIYDWQGPVVSFLYRVVGIGTAALNELGPGEKVTFLGPLGQPFPQLADDQAAILIGGGVGLPPVASWLQRWGRAQDRGYFGARDGADVPWGQLQGSWQVSVDEAVKIPEDQVAFRGRVTDLVDQDQSLDDSFRRVVLACGPIPMLKAAAALADARGWDCFVSLEEHMGCGYGACKGCVVPVTDPEQGYRNATCCQEGPVFSASDVVWDRYGVSPLPTVE